MTNRTLTPVALLLDVLEGTEVECLEHVENLTMALDASDMAALLTASGNLAMRCAVLQAHLLAAAHRLLTAAQLAALQPVLRAERQRLKDLLDARGMLHVPQGNA